MDDIKKFYLQILTDDTFVKRLLEKNNLDECKKIAKETGYERLKDNELETIMKIFKKQQSGDELTDDELKIVTGGRKMKEDPSQDYYYLESITKQSSSIQSYLDK